MGTLVGQEADQDGQQECPEPPSLPVGRLNPVAGKELQKELLGQILGALQGIALGTQEVEHRLPIRSDAAVHRVQAGRTAQLLRRADDAPGGGGKIHRGHDEISV